MVLSKWMVLMNCPIGEGVKTAAQLRRVAVLQWVAVLRRVAVLQRVAVLRRLPWRWPYLENSNQAKTGVIPGHRQKIFAP